MDFKLTCVNGWYAWVDPWGRLLVVDSVRSWPHVNDAIFAKQKYDRRKQLGW